MLLSNHYQFFTMKTKLKYPIFSFSTKGNMIYVFRTEKLYTTTNTELLKKRKNYIVVDATGTKYVETGAQNHTVRYRLPYLWSWKEEDEVAVFIDNYGDVIRKEDLDFWKLDIYLDEDNCYQSHSKTEYCWGLRHVLQSKTDK